MWCRRASVGDWCLSCDVMTISLLECSVAGQREGHGRFDVGNRFMLSLAMDVCRCDLISMVFSRMYEVWSLVLLPTKSDFNSCPV